ADKPENSTVATAGWAENPEGCRTGRRNWRWQLQAVLKTIPLQDRGTPANQGLVAQIELLKRRLISRKIQQLQQQGGRRIQKDAALADATGAGNC
ncbi:hypothetical protein VS893_24545, partial [Shigella flexneri]|nr:hypothetical protein [Shigella flexneri]